MLTADSRARLIAAQGERWVEVARAPWEKAELAEARAAIAAFIRVHLSDALGSRLFADASTAPGEG